MKNSLAIRNLIKEKALAGEGFTRPEISKQLKVSPASVVDIINKLKNSNILIEPGVSGIRTGRKASYLYLNKSYNYLLGVDLKPNCVHGMLIDFSGKILSKKQFNICGENDIQKSHDAILKLVNYLSADKPNKKINGISFGDPGLVDIDKGISIQAVHIKGWENLNTLKWLQDEFKFEHSLIYPAQMTRAYYEYTKESKLERKSLFVMWLEEGVGGAFIHKDDIFIGDNSAGMEVGHIVVEPNGPVCKCGNKGCLEAIVGVNAIKKRIKEMLDSGVTMRINKNDISISNFIQCVNNADKSASSLAYEISEKIGISLASIVAILNPGKIILCGELTNLEEILTLTIKRILTMHSYPGAIKNLSLEISSGDEFSDAYGAAILLRDKILDYLFITV